MRILTAAEIPLVGAQTMARIGQHSVGFVRVLGHEEDAVIAGSGTLVTARGRHAVLTADHVLEQLPSSGDIWLVVCREGWSRLHRFSVDARTVVKISVGKASHTASGPDLGLLVLAPRDVTRFEALQTFYNLEKRLQRMREAQAISEYGWALFGMVNERTIDAAPEGRFTRVKGFFGNVGFGAKPIERSDAIFDYLDFVALYNEHYDGPENYQGTSGGGLWQLEYREQNGQVEVSEALLSGVAYFQSARPADTRTIFCHGRKSIYELAYSALRNA